jgi:lycopene cyclase domain-containing protein
MSTYLLLNLGIILFPLILSFEKKIRFYRKIPFIFLSVLIVGGIYIIWDVYATSGGHWSFNKEYVGGIEFFGLPLEEILFFVTVPYAMIFLYETFHYYLKNKLPDFKLSRYSIIISLILFATAIYFQEQSYTFLALLSCAVYFMIQYIYKKEINSGVYWAFILFSYFPFFLVNYILTSLPVVEYNPNAIWGIRATTIPLEDFFYSFSLISFYILVYNISVRFLSPKGVKS